MTIKHLRIFVTVYQHLNITHAAQLLHMTQPAVTRAIQELERYYDICLFERINHRLYVTDSGEKLYAHALHITSAFDAMEEELTTQKIIPKLRIGASITLGNFLLPKLLPELKKAHPELDVHVTISRGAAIEQALLDNDIDVGLIEGAVSCRYLTATPFTSDCLLLITPPGHELLTADSICLSDTAQYPMLLRENGSAGRTLLNHIFALHDIPLEPVWESTSTQAIVNGVSAGLGISFLPKQLVLEDILSGRVATRELEDEKFFRTNYIVWHQNKHLTPSMKAFIDMCV